MNKQIHQLNIAEPCTENWSEMTPNSKGRHCDQCEKTVIDFTGKTDRQIINEMKQANGSVCGRLRQSQTGKNIQLDYEFVRNTKWKTFGLMIAGLMGTGTSYAQVPPESSPIEQMQLIGEVDYLPTTTEQKNIVSGRVLDEESGEPLPFVTVLLKDTSLGVATDLEGNFQIELTEGLENVDLIASYLGYTTVETQANLKKQHSFDILMPVDTQAFLVGMVVYTKQSKNPFKAIKRHSRNKFHKLKNFLANRKERRENRQLNKATRFFETTGKETSTTKDQNQNTQVLSSAEWIVNAYPNPFSQQINVVLQFDKEEEVTLVLYDDAGRQLFSTPHLTANGQTTATLNLKGLKIPHGSYFLSVLQGAEVLQTKLMIRGDGQ